MSRFKEEVKQHLEREIPKLLAKGHSSKEMAALLQVSPSSIRRVCKRLNLSIPNYHNRLKFNNTVFDVIDTEEKAYWLGFLFADGNIAKNNNVVTLSLKDADKTHIEKFNTFLENQGKITQGGSVFKYYRVCVCNKHFKEQLVRLGCVPAKSLILKFPNLNIFKNKDLVFDFIRGYVDGDGCLTFSRNGRLSLQILGTKEFLEGIMKMFPDKFHLYKITRLKSNTWTLNNCGENADFVTTKLYKNAKIYLERKYNRFVVLCRNTEDNEWAKSVKAEMLIPS